MSRRSQERAERKERVDAVTGQGLSRRGFLDALADGLIGFFVLIALYYWWGLDFTDSGKVAEARQKTVAFRQSIPAAPAHKVGTKRYDDPPSEPGYAYGATIGLLTVPKWRGLTNNNMPIMEGTGNDVLDLAAAGHQKDTAMPGQVGNCVLAGHRRTNGNSFRFIHRLAAGDRVCVETKTNWYVYKVTSSEIVRPNQTEAIAPVPGHPEAKPTKRLITLYSCNNGDLTSDAGEYGNTRRWLVHGELEYWMKRADGHPDVVTDAEAS